MYRKIHAIFAVSLLYGHDTVVLGPLGCGAYRNPPEHVAQIFQHVIQEYYGCFKRIVFAIIDDHNARLAHNPEGNLVPFQRIFSTTLCKLTSNIPSHDLEYCKYGGLCNVRNDLTHQSLFQHVPECENGRDCINVDATHRLLRLHFDCQFGALCPEWQDADHASKYNHPLACRNSFACQDMTEIHLNKFCHFPLCPDGLQCSKKGYDINHTRSYRHTLLPCRINGFSNNFCSQWYNPEHRRKFSHSFMEPCNLLPFMCSDTSPAHLEVRSHICRNGLQCSMLSDRNHLRKFIHVPKAYCKDGNNCKMLSNEDHLTVYSHIGIKDIRKLCIYGPRCKNQFDLDHVRDFMHCHNFPNANSDVAGINHSINLDDNFGKIFLAISSHHRLGDCRKYLNKEVIDWVMKLRPVHRCKLEIFKSILTQSHLLSNRRMEDFYFEYVSSSATQLPEVIAIRNNADRQVS